jgi:hypothetical protein
MKDFSYLIETLKVEALASKLYPTSESNWRWFCRQYSEKFHTPLHLVLEMSPELVLLNVFESQTDSLDLENSIVDIMDKVYVIEDPSYEAAQEKDLQDFIKDAEAEERQRVADGKPAPGQQKNSPFAPKPKKVTPKKEKELPKEGFINLSYLENSDNER